MGKPIGEVAIKGKSIDEHLLTKEGRSLLTWVVNQPVEAGPYAAWSQKRNQYIQARMLPDHPDTEQAYTPPPIEDVPKILEKTMIEKKLNTITEKLDTVIEILSRSGVSWDDEK